MGQANTRILVVDDYHDSADSLCILLQGWGYTTATAYNGKAALDIVATFDPDIVFLNISRPEMNGLEVARRLLSQPTNHPRHVIAMTGHGHDKIRIQAYESGFECYLLKPVDKATLLATLRRYG